MGYLIARKISLSILRINAKMKKGMETNVPVDASGSLFSRAIINAIIINANEIKRVRFFPKSPDVESPFISGSVVSRDTDEKQRR